ncbi:MAG: helix-turn-helix domain-containing protein [Clostridiales bacterium]|nr:helix-turn-helix domain-containing protein [Clostridiales bacterium]
MDWVRIIQDAIEDIEANLCGDISADIIAERHHISSYYFQKMFSALCDMTISEYIRNRRLSEAAFEIKDGKANILDIALKYGFDSHEGFTKAFSRFHGCTPNMAKKSIASLSFTPKIDLYKMITGGKIVMNDLQKRGYLVKETGAVYYTTDMDKTLAWFTDVLGWYGQIDARDENNVGMYGCVNNIPIEFESLGLAPFTGIHMFYGETDKRMIGFMKVEGIDQLHDFVISRGWKEIEDVVSEPWGSKSCVVTTIDGCKLKFFE